MGQRVDYNLQLKDISIAKGRSLVAEKACLQEVKVYDIVFVFTIIFLVVCY